MADTGWIGRLRDAVSQEGAAVRVLVIRADGSVPRDIGTAMIVTEHELIGTIGGGALEYDAMAHARLMLREPRADEGWTRDVRSYPLGPSLGQCCGGHVRLLFERFEADETDWLGANDSGRDGFIARPAVSGTTPAIIASDASGPDLPAGVARQVRAMAAGRHSGGLATAKGEGGALWVIEPLVSTDVPLYLYGAGHVGRALVRVLPDLPFAVRWIDTAEERFPNDVPAGVEVVVADDPARAAGTALQGSYHLVMTYSHALDLAVCHAVLRSNDFSYLGLIGSDTKKARFLKRLREHGVDEPRLRRLISPIGIGGIRSKDPAAIAVSVAADLLQRLEAAPDSVVDTGRGEIDHAPEKADARPLGVRIDGEEEVAG